MNIMWKTYWIYIAKIFFLFNMFIQIPPLCAQNTGQWEVLNEVGIAGIYYDIPRIQFTNEDVGWIASRHLLYKTEDGGENWSFLPLDENWDFRGFKFRNDTLGYAYGTADSVDIVKSEDGGLSWMPVFNLPENYYMRDISFAADSIIYAIGNDAQSENYYGWAMKSVNGGATWDEITPNNPKNNALFLYSHFYDSSCGFIVGNDDDKIRILRTNNGGTSWEEQISNQFDEILELQVVNDSLIYFTASHNTNSTHYYLCVSADTLNNWQVIQTSENYVGPFYALTDNNIFSFFKDSVDNLLMNSTDGGTTWDIKKTVEDAPLSIYFTPQQQGFYIDNIDHSRAGTGKYGLPQTYFLYKSIDGGDTWHLKKYTYPFTDIFLIDQNSGFLTGGIEGAAHGPSFGRLFKTNDGGITWDFVPHLANEFYVQCKFFNRETGFIRTAVNLLKTSDGGNTWIESPINNQDSTGIAVDVRDVSFLNEQIIYVAARARWSEDSSGAAIFHTANGGENWDLVWKYPNTEEYDYSLNSIHSVKTDIWAVGRNGLIVSSDDSDSFRVLESITDLPLNDVFFSDTDHGWITGGYFNNQGFQSILLKTTDSGKRWRENRFEKYILNDLYFANSLHGWIVGKDTSGNGMILESSDGGDTRLPQIDNLNAPLTAIHFKDGVGWAVGGYGLVLRTDNWATWIDQNTGKIYPNKYNLSQNYPNPFNPLTNIKFSLPRSEIVTINLYNTLGQKVKTILNKRRQTGNHIVELNARNLASGVYYYRIEAGEYTNVKKMILLK
jgi:photosystem II stability/assembly factor-like uncharacterized protein